MMRLAVYWARGLFLASVALAAFAMSACDSDSSTPTPLVVMPAFTLTSTATSTAGPSPTPMEVDLPELKDVLKIELEDGWSGFSRPDHVDATYALVSSGTEYKGTAHYSAHAYNIDASKTYSDIVVPSDVIDSFVVGLAKSQPQTGKDKCKEPDNSFAGDNWPYINIVLRMRDSQIEFFSCTGDHAQGVSVYKPTKRGVWYVTYQGGTYVIPSEQPTDAYALLDSYLRKDRFEQFYDDAAEIETDPKVIATQTTVANMADIVMAQVRDATVINITDVWRGKSWYSSDSMFTAYSAVSPLSAQITITRTGDFFEGTGRYMVGDAPAISRTETIQIPIDMVDLYLEILSNSPVDANPYVPSQTVPIEESKTNTEIQIQLKDQVVRFHTEAEGKLHRPWAIDIRGDTYNINSADPSYALGGLEGEIHAKEVMEDLIEQVAAHSSVP